MRYEKDVWGIYARRSGRIYASSMPEGAGKYMIGGVGEDMPKVAKGYMQGSMGQYMPGGTGGYMPGGT